MSIDGVAPLRRALNRRKAILIGALVLAVVAYLGVVAGPVRAAATLLSQGKTATASSVENGGTPAGSAVDGNTGTRWSSAAADPQWLQVDLGSTASITQVVLTWETAYATAFQIQVSADATTWTSIYSTTTGTGGTQTLNITGTGRYVRMYGTARATQYGYSLWEFQVYGTLTTGSGCGTANAALNKAATASSVENAGTPATSAVDGNGGTRWSSAATDPQWLQVDLGSSASICQVGIVWEAAYATAFQIQVSANATTWTTVYSTTTGTGGTQTLNITGTGRYIRMYGTARATGYGYSIWEFSVFTGSGGSTSPTPSPTPTPTTSPTSGNCGPTNVAIGRPATASSLQDGNPMYAATYAVDDNLVTRWSSLVGDPQWLQVDLGGALPLCQIVLTWENAYSSGFQIQLSNDATNWTNIYTTTTGTGGKQTVNVAGTGRYLRINMTARGTAYGDSLWELAVYTVGGVTAPWPTPPAPQPAPGNCPWVNSTAPTATKVAQVIAAMTLDQKVAILHGTDNPDYIGFTTGIPALCIPDLHLEDGPLGVGDGLGGVTQMPDGPLSAATFDPIYEKAYGAAVGAEFAGKGVNVALGPTINIIRDPRWGRSYETYGEDPYLTGTMVTANVQGIQGQGVMAEVKHAAVYNIEQPAGTIIVDPRTVQEIYLPAFQMSIEQGGAAAIMCGYSNVNNVPACQNAELLKNGLYQQAGFTGFVTSDWGGAHSTVDSANNGMTVEMPGGYFYGDFLIQAVNAGQVSMATLNQMDTRVLTQMFNFGMFNHAQTGTKTAIVTTPQHAAVGLQGIEEGTVLLKNSGILPLSSTSGSIAVIGVDASSGTQTIGGGSGTVTSVGTVNPLEGIKERLAGTGVTVNYDDGTNQATATALAASSSVAIVFASDAYGHEEADNPSLNLPNNQDALISAVAAANPNTIVVLNDNAAIMMPWLNQVKGVFEGFYAGQMTGRGIAALLFGDVNPSGKLPMTFPTSLTALPASTAAQWPGVNGTVNYSEGLQVGYRWYDANNVTPLFPFGYGLSYTSFAYSNIHVGALTGNTVTVTATVTNTGSRSGTDVAQLYVGQPAANGEPPHQLNGFQRITLNPGAAGTVTFTLPVHAFAHWDNASSSWIASAGAYQILVGNSSRNLPLTGSVTLASTITTGAQP